MTEKKVEVIQADREVAADMHAHVMVQLGSAAPAKDLCDTMTERMRAGWYDDDESVQAFARHRFTHSSEEVRLRGQEAVCDAVHEALWKADAEVARLREALEDIATIKRSAYEAARIARTALSGSTLMEGMGD